MQTILLHCLTNIITERIEVEQSDKKEASLQSEFIYCRNKYEALVKKK